MANNSAPDVAAGFWQGGVSLVSGIWTLIKAAPKFLYDTCPLVVAYRYSDRYCNGDRFETEKQVFSASTAAIQFLAKLEFQLMNQQTQVQALTGVLTDDPKYTQGLPPELKQAVQVGAELLTALKNASNLSAYDRGRLAGRITFEIANALYGGELLEVGKLGLVKSLSGIRFFTECAPVKAALTSMASMDSKLTALMLLTKLVEGSGDAARASRLLKLWLDIRIADNTLSAWEAWAQVVADLKAAGKTKDLTDNAIVRATSVIVNQAYKEAIVNGTVTSASLAKVPTVEQVAQVMKPDWLENHHTVPKFIQRILGIKKAQFDNCPALLLDEIEHRTGDEAFHKVLKDFIAQLSDDPSNPSPEEALEALEKTYSSLGRNDIWKVDRAWFTSMGIP